MLVRGPIGIGLKNDGFLRTHSEEKIKIFTFIGKRFAIPSGGCKGQPSQ